VAPEGKSRGTQGAEEHAVMFEAPDDACIVAPYRHFSQLCHLLQHLLAQKFRDGMSHGAYALVFIVSVAVSAVSASAGAGSASLGTSSKRQAHANDYHTTPIGLYTENVYWNSRKRSDELRAKLGALESLTSTSLQGGVSERVWDLFYPDYNCPLVKERVGRIGETTRCAERG